MTANVVYEPAVTTHWKNLFASKTMLLGSHNLNEGEELILQIASVAIEEIKNQNGKPERVPVIKFNNAPPMVLNITNARTIASLYGERHDYWIGRYIQLYSALIKVKGVEQTALRVKLIKPQVGVDFSAYEKQIRSCKDIQELQKVFMSLPREVRPKMNPIKDEMKEVLANA